MDSKRLDKHSALKKLLLMACILAMASCTWVKDDTDECAYGFWLKLSYTHNILDVEAAQKYVTDAYVYVYDASGNYVKRIYATHSELKANGYRIRVEDLPEGNYQFVVWSGIGSSQYAVSGDTKAIDDFRVAIASPVSPYKEQLPPLYHGYLPAVHYDDTYALHTVSMMKNTNQLACLVVPMDEQTTMATGDYALRVVAANTTMDAYNSMASDSKLTYEPFEQGDVTLSDPDYGQLQGVQFSITTLRLMANSDSRIILEKKSTGQTVFNISFPEYIGMIGSLYTAAGRQLSVQEYLDRQDFYTIVFYLSGDLERLMQLKVNSWRLRAYNHIKL